MTRWRVAAGLLCLGVAAAAITYPLVWQHHQQATGDKAVAADQAHAQKVEQATGGTCSPHAGPGVLSVPALGVVAPVKQGLSDAVLSVALGHDPSTGWPAPGSSSLIAGHDVGYLSGETSLRVGDAVDYEEPCATLHFSVVHHEVTTPGQRVPLPHGGGLVLDTCWPTDALWYTPKRYLVVARYVSTTPRSAHRPSAPTPPPVPAVVLPSGLAGSSLTLTANPWPMGHLTIQGTPSTAWKASQSSLTSEADALEILFGLRHALDGGNTSWLASLAPGVTVGSWLAGTPAASLNVTETVQGRTVRTVKLSSAVGTASGTQSFALTVTPGHGWRATSFTSGTAASGG